MKPNKVNGRVIIIICIVVLIILGVFWLLINNTGREGYDSSKGKAFADKITTGITSIIDNAPVEVNGGYKMSDVKSILPKIFFDLKRTIDKEVNTVYDISVNTDIKTSIDTTKSRCHADDNFMYGEKFGDSLVPNYNGKAAQLNSTCSQLTADNCNLTDSCVLVNGKKCMAGDANGPTMNVDNNGQDIDYAYYTYKSECYGTCGTGANYANPCSEFANDDTGINKKCVSRMWGQTGCPNRRYVTDDVADELSSYSKAGIKSLFKKAKAEENYANCYGPNERDWPKPCDVYPKDTSKGLSVRCLRKLYNDEGCENERAVITPMFAKDNELISKSEMKTEFAIYTQGIDGSGNVDSDYTKCYGPDETTWPEPCHNTKEDSTGLSKRCLTGLFKNTGCPAARTSNFITYEYASNNKDKTKGEMQQTYDTIRYNMDDESFTKCYGKDKKKWPVRSMLIGLGFDNKIYLKYFRPWNKSVKIEDAPWEEDTTPNQTSMNSIVQLPNGWFYGTGTDNILYMKRYWTDPWIQDSLIGSKPRFYRVKIIWGMIIAVGLNRRLYLINRNPSRPGVYYMGGATCCVDDVLESPTGFPISVIGHKNYRVWRRPFGWQNWRSRAQANGWVLAIINIPDGKYNSKGIPSGKTKVLGIGLKGLLFTKNTIDDYWWSPVRKNNGAAVRNISYARIYNNVPENSTDPPLPQ